MAFLSRFAILTIAMVFGLLAQGTPIDSPHATDITLAKMEHKHLCGKSTFENRNSAASPLVSDCLQIATNIDAEGSWSFWDCMHHEMLKFGSCRVGVEGADKLCKNTVQVANGDIIDIIKASVDGYQFDGRVGTRGYMDCPVRAANGNMTTVLWGLY